MRLRWLAITQVWLSLVASYDFEIWQDNTVKFPINERSNVVFSNEFRYQDMARYLAEYYCEVIYSYNVLTWLRLAPQYRQTFVRSNTSSPYLPVYSPMFNVVIFGNYHKWSFSDRHRAQLNINKWGKTTWVYRNRFEAQLPSWGNKFKVRPYIADEFFFTQGRGFSQNRIYVGFNFTLNPAVNIKLYGIYRNVKNASHQWNTAGVFGSDFGVKF